MCNTSNSRRSTRSSTTQTGATWGLDRIDQRNLPLNNTYTYTSTGTGVTAYIIDTGIRITHNEFGGRASFGPNYANGPNDDCNGHGTHVAGTVGGATYGVAKNVTLVAVKVLNCAGSGSTSWRHQRRQLGHGERDSKPAVANMSLGGGASTAIDTAVNNAIGSGVTFAVAAGNSNANACNYSPARAAERDHGRRDDQHRRPRVVLQLRHLPRHLRAGIRHHVGVERRATPPPTRSAARRWPRRTSRAWPRCTSSLPERIAKRRRQRAESECHDGQGDDRGNRKP